MATTKLPQDPKLSDVQSYVAAMVQQRGFDDESVQDNFIMLTEEVGELAKALRKQCGVKIAADSVVGEIADEAADVLWMLVCVCNQLGIDLEQALRDKETKNNSRSWQ